MNPSGPVSEEFRHGRVAISPRALLDPNVIMVSDANATLADTQHAAALNTFMMFFGDVMMADEVERCLEGAG